MRLLSKLCLLVFFLSSTFAAFSQVAIGTGANAPNPDTNAVLLLEGNGSQGIIIPKVASLGTFGKPGMIVYNTATGTVHYFNTTWVQVGSGAGGTQGIQIVGNKVLIGTGAGFSTEFSIANTAPTIQGQILMWDTSLNSGAGGWTSSANTAPSTIGQVLKWNGSRWEPGTDNTGSTALPLGQIFVGNSSNVATATAPSAIALNNFGAPTNDVPFGNRKITNLATPTLATDAATKAYVDGITPTTITGTIAQSQVTNLTTDLGNKVTANGPIIGATNTKITYDAKGLVTSGSALSASDLPVMTATVGGAVPTPPNNTTTFLRGDGTFATPAGGGTVTTASVVSANGFNGTVATPSSTPAITIGTTLSGILRGNGTGLVVATGADLPAMTSTVGGAVPTPPNNTTTFLRGDGTFATPAGGGTVTNVTATGPINVANGSSTPTLTLSPLVDADISATAGVAGTKINPAFGTQNITTTTGSASIGGGINVGLANGFTINNAGNITKINGATTSFPTTNAAGVLTNDGTGTLAWSAGGVGSVTNVSVTTANGFSGSVATPSSTPAITIGTSLSGLLKGDGTGLTVATAGTDYVASETDPAVRAINGLVKSNGTTISAATGADLPAMTSTVGGAVPTPPNNTTTFLRGDGTFATPAGGGTVTTTSVVNANGFTGTVANATSTPAITIGTALNGILRGNGTGIALATAGTDYLTPTGSAAGLTGFPTLNQNTTGNAATATTLATGRTIALTGDVTYTSPTFDGSTSITGAATVARLQGRDIVNTLPTNGQVLKWNNTLSQWEPAADDVGGGATPTLNNGQILIGNGTSNSAAALSGDAQLSAGVITIQPNAVTTAKILDGTIAGADLANNITINTTGNVTAANFTGNGSGLTGITATVADASITGGPAGAGVKIAANTITDDNINASANIADSKLATISTAGKVSGSAITTGTIGGNTIINTTGNITAANFTGNGSGLTGLLPAQIPSLDASKIASGTLAIAQGGTNSTATPTSGGISYGTGTAYGFTAAGTGGQLLQSNGAAAPSWVSIPAFLSPTLTSGQLFVGNGSNVATGVAMSGDAGISNAGLLTIQPNSINSSKILDGEIVNADINAAAAIAGTKINPDFGAQNIQTTGTLTTGTAGAFAIDATGNITKIRNVTTSFPTAQGAANSVLTNDGAGNLTWAAGSGWGLTGNAGTNPATNFIGTTDVQPLIFKVNNDLSGKIEYGNNASTLLGWRAGNVNTGNNNVALGKQALENNTTGGTNTSVGSFSLNANISGFGNTAIGADALSINSSGNNNTAVGRQAGVLIDGLSNATAIGFNAKVATSNSLVLGGTGVDAVNVGIGTTSPRSPLQIGNLLGFVDDGANSQNIIVRGLYSDGSNFRNIGTTGSSAILLGDERTGLFTFPAGAANAVAASPSMRFNVRPSGVGIQVDNPIETFQVNGATYLNPITAPGVTTDRLYNVGGSLFWNGTNISSGGSGWALGGNTGTIDGVPGTGTNYIGTRDNVPLNFMVNNTRSGRIDPTVFSTFFGFSSGQNNTGISNTGIGNFSLAQNSTGTNNTALGTSSLANLGTGDYNTGVGGGALFNHLSGSSNTAMGYGALSNSINASWNTAVGKDALWFTTGQNNTALGGSSGVTNTTGNNNTFLGYQADATANNLTNATAMGYNAKVGASNSLVLGGTGVDAVNVGIGTSTPLSRLHLKQSLQVNDVLTDGGSGFYGAGMMFENNGTADAYYMGYTFGGYFSIGNKTTSNVFTGLLYASPNGVGIFNATPTEKLDVTGNVKFSGALMPNNLPGTAGQVLTSAGAGLPPTWTTPGGGGNMLAANNLSELTNFATARTNLGLGSLATLSTVGSAQITNGTIDNIDIANVDASKITTGTLPVARGGSGLGTTPVNGQLLIGNGTGYSLATLTQGSGVTITNGAGTITIASSGMTNPLTTNGDIIYGVGSTPTRLAAGTGFLRGGAVPSYAAVNLASADVSGILPIANGGTGAITAPTALTNLGGLSNTLTNGNILVGSVGNVATGVAMSGDANISNTGLVTIQPGAISGGTGGDITDGTITDADVNASANIAGTKIAPSFGAQNIVTTGTLTTGTAGAFAIDATGNITKIRNVTTAFPAAQGVANSVLTNDGAGNLTWAAGSGWGLTGNTLAGTERIGSDNAQPLVLETNNTERMRINPTGIVGIGTTSFGGNSMLYVNGGVQVDAGDNNTGTSTHGLTFGSNNSGEVIASQKQVGGPNQNGLDFYTGFVNRMAINAAGNVGIGTATPLSKLDVVGDMRLAQGTAPGVTTDKLYNVGGNLFWNGTNISSGGSGWGLGGTLGTLDGIPGTGTNYIGTRDNVPLNLIVNNQRAGRIEAAASNANTMYGFQSGNVNTGIRNAGYGYQALLNNAAGERNAAFGYQAMLSNTTGNGNTAVGSTALSLNTTGGANAAFGTAALESNTGSTNTAVGNSALNSNTTASNNTAVGTQSLAFNTIGASNSALGAGALLSSTTGSNNTAVGVSSLGNNLTGSGNTALGFNAEVATGALTNATAIGANASVTASNTIQLGDAAVTAVNVGTGTTAKLVAGQLQVTGGTLGAGRVLTSDASGNATWQPAGGGGLISSSGSNTLTAGNSISTAGIDNAIFGNSAGAANTGNYNVFVGANAALSKTAGDLNTIIGWYAGNAANTAAGNTLVGAQAGEATTGAVNTFIGEKAGQLNTTGNQSVFIGNRAGDTNTTGDGHVIIGNNADVGSISLSNAAAIGFRAQVNQSNSLVLGSINGVNGATATTSVGIGTTTPAQRLHINEPSTTQVYMRITNAAATNGINIGLGGAGSQEAFIANNQNSPMYFQTNATNRMVIDASGNVGVGTINPNGFSGRMLHLSGTGNTGYILEKTDATPRKWGMVLGGSGEYVIQDMTAGGVNPFLMQPGVIAGQLYMKAGGFTGINNSNPLAPLDIATTNNIFLFPTTSSFFNSFNGGGLSSGLNPTPSVAVRATGAFLSIGTGEAAGYYVQSDERIKRKVGISDSRNDLATLMKLKITDYKYTDSLNSRNIQVKGVFAQEVEKIYPQAISKQTNWIPNIYALANQVEFDDAKQTLTVTMARPHNLAVGDKVKLISSTSGEKPSVVASVDGNTFTVSNWTEKSEKIFVFGKEVNDFRIVDYDRLFTLNLSATQELVKMLDEQKKMIDELKAKEEESKKKIAVLEASLNKVAAGETELNNLKSEIEKIKAALGLSVEATVKKTEEKTEVRKEK